MKILMCHNFYQQRGGEDEVFEAEGALLQEHGHEVVQHTLHNENIQTKSRIAVGLGAIWNQKAFKHMQNLVRKEKPDLVHFYNTFPLFSPSVYYAVKAAGIPLVQSIHNYRLLCLNATFYRNESICEDCLGRAIPIPGVRHACYHDSRLQSLSVAGMQVLHRLLGSWHKKVDLFLLGSTNFALDKFIRGGYTAEAFMLKPNFVNPDPGIGNGEDGNALFVGRLDDTKGVETLLRAWQLLDHDIPLTIIGDGPLREVVSQKTRKMKNVKLLGRMPLSEVYNLMKRARCLVFPSVWYEAMPRTIIESFAVGTPVCAADTGAMSDMIVDGKNGVLFEPGNSNDLAEKIQVMFKQETLRSKMREYARQSYLDHYTAEQNYELITKAYKIAARRSSE